MIMLLLVDTVALLVAGMICVRQTPGVFISGAEGDAKKGAVIRAENKRHLLKVVKVYRGLGLGLTILLAVTVGWTTVGLVLRYPAVTQGVLALYDVVLGGMVAVIFRRVDRYEKLLADTL